MGRANVYLPDDLERRVKAAGIPISEVCQQALLSAVEAAEAQRPALGEAVGDLYRQGVQAGERWAGAASSVVLLALVRDQRLEEIPADQLPESWYSLSEELTTAWEAGFVEAARTAARRVVKGAPVSTGGDQPGAGEAAAPADEAAAPADEAAAPADESPLLGDGSASYLGVDQAGRRIAFDPHAAVAEDKSPLFAVLGPADQRARLALTIAQDAACRGVAVVLLDLSGQLTPRARGLGKIVRFPSTGQQQLPSIEALLGSAGGMGGLWDMLAGLSTAGAGLFPMPGGSSSQHLVTPGYVTVLTVSADSGLGGVPGAVNALRALAELTTKAAHPRLLLVDLPTGIAVPSQLVAALGRFMRTARQNDVAFGLSAESAAAVADAGASRPLLSTVFAFPTSSPAEADRLRDLLGANAPILLNAPGFVPQPEDEVWCTMRDFAGRLGQVRLDAT